jgi:quinol monooxygenase YgiN
MNTEINCIARFVAKADCVEQLKAALMALLEPTRSEAGCISYRLNVDVEHGHVFTMIEKFKSQEAFDLHSQQPYLQNLLSIVGDLTESVEVNTYQAL